MTEKERPARGYGFSEMPKPRPRRSQCLLLMLLEAASFTSFAAEIDQANTFELPELEVVGTAPLPAIGLSLNRVPGNVQILSGKQIDKQQPNDISDLLNQNLGSVNINDTQGNPFQVDVNFRGFTASPVLGTPQGLSVFVDGVRVNEDFGDVVNWNLIPGIAIANLSLVPAANPAFGLGSLGGAIAVNTKSGFQFPGTRLRAYGGSFGRRAAELETGGHVDRVDYFASSNLVRESGWAEHNPSRVAQLFGKTGYEDDKTDLDLSYTFADTRLEGAQTLPLSFLNTPGESYTYPDTQSDQLHFVNFKVSHYVADDLLISANAHVRFVDTDVLNSNVNDNFDPTMPVGPGNQPTGNVINRIRQSRPGASLQLNWSRPLEGHQNDFTLGANYEHGKTRFRQLNQEAGASRDTSSNSPTSLDVSLKTSTTDVGVYFTDNFAIAKQIFLTLSARYDRVNENLKDQLGIALNGDHNFSRFNPAAGLVYNPTQYLTAYVSYGEGTRAPTPIELTCADPGAPCSLPNGFSGDPDLKPVVSKSWEAGARGHFFGKVLFWNASVFHSELLDDIQFISSGGGATSSGYFSNVGRTRRQGAELGLNGKLGDLNLSLHYSLVLATFETSLVLNSPSNSSQGPINCATCTDIQVRPGDRIPGIPRHNLKVRGEYAFTQALSVAINALAQSNQFARSDENNHDANGPVPGYVLVNAELRYDFDPHWQFLAKANNLLDTRYYTFGLLSENEFTGPGNSFDTSGATWRAEQFRSVGAPIGGWTGIQYRF